MKNFIILFIAILPLSLLSQVTGSFLETIQSNNEDWDIYVHVSDNFQPSNNLGLLIALHGCGQDGQGYRDQLKSLSDGNELIIVAPNIPSTKPQLGKMLEDDRAHIILSIIDWAKNTYLVNPNNIYLTGFSCNGGMTLHHGLSEIYNFKGIIPFNSYLHPDYRDNFNLDSKVPTCICSGTADGNYNSNNNVHSELSSNGGVSFFNSIDGVGHTLNFPELEDEMQECINWINGVVSVEGKDKGFNIYPNPSNGKVFIKSEEHKIDLVRIYNSNGQMISTLESNSNQIIVNTEDQVSPGIYFLEIHSGNEIINEKIIIGS